MRVGVRVGVVAIALVFCARVAATIATSSATIDEPEYITAGYSYLATHELRLEHWHPPLAFLAAGLAVRARFDVPFHPAPAAWAAAEPRAIAREFVYGGDVDATAMLRTARVPSLVAGLVTLLAIGAWAAQLWGPRAGWFALVLAACDPNLIANSALATPDIFVTCFLLLALFATWRYLRAPTLGGWLAICAACACAAATKHVGLLAMPLVGVALVAHVLAAGEARAAQARALGRTVGVTVAIGAAVLAVAVAIGGAQVIGAFAAIARSVRDQAWHLHHLPLAFLHGEVRRGGWWHYYLVAIALKTPLGTLALVAVAAARPELGAPLPRTTALALCAPIAAVIALITWTQIDLGVRLVLPALPFALVFAARAATLPGARWRWATRALLALTVLASAAATTNELGYFNAAARVAGGGPRWLTDSNVDWGQDLDRLARYLRAEDAPPIYLAYYGGGSPTYAGIRHATLPTAVSFPPNADVIDDADEPTAPCAAARQLLAISAFRQLGIIERDRTQYAWLADREPIAELGTSIRVYDVTTDAEAHARLAVALGADTPAGQCEARRAITLDPSLAARFARTR